ncbi:MAG: sortase [Patescibacteria group bacterium]
MNEFKKLIKYFVLIFFLSFLVINWSEISWIFNYRAVSRYASDLSQKVSGEETASTTADAIEKGDSIEIPAIGITAPFIVDKKLNDVTIYGALDTGVVLYPTSVLPGQKGQTVILGHSAPANWPKIKYDWVFSKISELKAGDKITVNYDGKEFDYSVTRTIFLNKGDAIPQSDSNSSNVLVLVSCWPPGTDSRRIAVEAVKI